MLSTSEGCEKVSADGEKITTENEVREAARDKSLPDWDFMEGSKQGNGMLGLAIYVYLYLFKI